jgi:hypothetical protein
MLISNFRPVAILSVPAKIFEIIMCEKIALFLKPVMSERQHGFQSKKSITTNMINFTEYVSSKLNDNSQVDVIFTDLAKAFDRVDYSIILNKMHNVGFSCDLVMFFYSYFSNRLQYVSYKGCSSSRYVVTSGVPQGSNLGPCLFNLFFNDIVGCVKDSHVLLYADDLKLFREVKCDVDQLILQEDLNSIVTWSYKNKISFNIKKCKVMTFTRKKFVKFTDYSINNEILHRVNEFRDLGLVLDPALSFNQHVTLMVNKAYRNLGFIIRQSRNFKSIATLKLLYFTLVRSILEFASVIWNPHFSNNIHLVEKVQKKFLRFLYFKVTGHFTYDIPYNELLKIFELDSLEKRRKIANLIFLFKLVRYQIDDPFCLSKINFYVPAFNNRSKMLFIVNFSRTKSHFCFSLNTMMRLYNTLPPNVDIFSNLVNTFKKFCHSYL